MQAKIIDEAFYIFVNEIQDKRKETDKLNVFDLLTLDKVRQGISTDLPELSVEKLLREGLIKSKKIELILCDLYYNLKKQNGGVNGENGGINGENGGVNSENGGINGENGGVNGENGGVNGENGGVNISDIEKIILETIKNNDNINTKNISKLLNMPLRTVERYLTKLKAKNLIEFCGVPKTGGYYLKK